MDPVDIEVMRGNSYRVIGFAFPFALEGSDLVMTIKWRGGQLEFTKADFEVVTETLPGDSTASEVVYWVPTVADSRKIPMGKLARYEIERRVAGGESRTYVFGSITGLAGLNSD